MKLNKSKFLGIVIFVILGFVYNYYNFNKRKILISKNTKQSIALYDSFIVFRNTGPQSFFNYKFHNQVYKIQKFGKFDFLKKGDSVLIKFSIENPDVAEVIDFCYMRRHKGKDYCKCN